MRCDDVIDFIVVIFVECVICVNIMVCKYFNFLSFFICKLYNRIVIENMSFLCCRSIKNLRIFCSLLVGNFVLLLFFCLILKNYSLVFNFFNFRSNKNWYGC